VSRSLQRLILFAKRPRKGRVKTRLVPPLSEDEALELYRALLADSARNGRAAAAGRAFEVCLDVPWRPAPVDLGGGEAPTITLQGPGDLGDRMLRTFRRSRETGAEATVIVGSDSPTLPPAYVESAFGLLAAGTPAVLGEASDGGYVLIGCREPVAALFREISWGGPDVARQTRERAREARVELARLPAWYDVDDIDGLRRLADELRDPAVASLAPATSAWLARVDAFRNSML
jgi:rSAM/selenodomain-associated transferase 1